VNSYTGLRVGFCFSQGFFSKFDTAKGYLEPTTDRLETNGQDSLCYSPNRYTIRFIGFKSDGLQSPLKSRFHPVARLQSYGRDVSREGVFPSSNHSRPSVDQRLWYSLLPPGCADGGAARFARRCRRRPRPVQPQQPQI
jgi:hypothetical protein